MDDVMAGGEFWGQWCPVLSRARNTWSHLVQWEPLLGLVPVCKLLPRCKHTVLPQWTTWTTLSSNRC